MPITLAALVLSGLSFPVPDVKIEPQDTRALAAPTPPRIEPQGLPGQLPGTEQWLVTFRSRSFDLDTFRAAMHSRQPASVVKPMVVAFEDSARTDQAAFVTFVEQRGGRVTEHFWIFNGCAVEIPPAELAAVRAHPEVLYLHANQRVEPVGTMPIKTATNMLNHGTDAIQAMGIRGQGVTIAIMDTGVDHPMGSTSRPHATCFIDGNLSNTGGGGISGSRLLVHKAIGAMPADDILNHGTGVCGIAGGGQWNNDGISDHGHAPHAGLANYSIANNSGGGSDLATIARAWQAIAADAAQYGIRTANNSYTGTPDPLDPSQQALDSCALNADVMICVAAANFGSSTAASQAAVNALAVGATNPDVKTIASFSSRGPLSGDTQRFYPDLCANGVNTVMPQRDDESPNVSYVDSGTSMASPQVCGAAALYRSVKTSANHLETRAALLASTEDVSAQNASPPYNSRNAYGMGYLRVDKALVIAAGLPGTLAVNSQLTTGNSSQTIQLPLVAGKAYAVTIAWDRLNVSQKNWSNLDLTARINGKTVAIANSPRNLYEKVVFLATTNGTADLIVQGVTLEQSSVPFALAAIETPPQFVPGLVLSYGQGCLGTGTRTGIQDVLPASYGPAFGNISLTSVIGGDNRVQQILDATQLPATPWTATHIALRQDDSRAASANGGTFDWQLQLGPTTVAPTSMSSTFANNITGPLTTVIARRSVNYVVATGVNSDPTNFPFRAALDAPYVLMPGQHLLLDSVRYSGATVGQFYVDAFTDTTNVKASLLSSFNTFPVGSLQIGTGLVLGFVLPIQGAVPQLVARGVPAIGGSYALNLTQAAPSAPGWLGVGVSNQQFGSWSLPFDLAPFGAPGCLVLASLEALLPLSIDAQGMASLTIPVPNDKSLIQAGFFHQATVFDPGANGLGVVESNALQALIGGQP